MKYLLSAFLFICQMAAQAQTDLTKRFDSLTQAYEQNGFHGVILVANGNTVLYQKGYGYANFDRRIPHTPATLFKTESVGKIFTATAIMQLVERGKLSLTQTVKDWLPELSVRNADKITINHLLRHTSGLQSPWDHPQWTFKKNHSKAELTKIVEEVPLAFDTPGKEMFYSNSGYFILGWIIEKCTGQPFDQYLQQQFFSPLKMTATGHLNDTIMPLHTGAQPYRIINSKRYKLMSETVGPKSSPAGGWVSTARDLYRFMQALSTGKLLKPATLQQMRTAAGANPTDSAYRFYAYGLETYINQGVPNTALYGHNGGGAGFSIDAFVDAQSGYIVVSCTNLYQNSRPIMQNYFRAALGKPLESVSKPMMVKLYDLIDSVGIEGFAQNEKAYFEQLGAKLHPRLFAEVSDAMSEAGDHALAARFLSIGRSHFPEDGMLLMFSGDTELRRGNKAEAKVFFEQAKLIGQKTNHARILQSVEEKLKAL